MVKVKIIDCDDYAHKYRVGKYRLEIVLPIGSREYHYVSIMWSKIPRNRTIMSVCGYFLPSVMNTLMKHLYNNNEDAVYLIMAFEPVLQISDFWTGFFLLKLLTEPAVSKHLPEKFEEVPKGSPKRAYSVITNIKRIRKIHKKYPNYTYINTVVGISHLMKNFSMPRRVRTQLMELFAELVSSSMQTRS